MIGQLGIGAEPYDLEQVAGQKPKRRRARSGWATLAPSAESARRSTQRELLHLVASCIDSGIPAIVGVPGHALVAVGVRHDRSSTRVRRGGRVLRSSDFLSAVVVNDDNFPPFQVAAWETNASGYRRSCRSFESLVMPLPDKVLLRPEAAEVITTDLLNELGPPSKAKKFVRRLFLTSSKNYKEDRRSANDGFTSQLLSLPMPHFVWVTEVASLVDWRTNREVLAEVGIDATAGPFDDESFLWIRYPNQLIVNTARVFDISPGNTEADNLLSRKDLRVRPFAGNLHQL